MKLWNYHKDGFDPRRDRVVPEKSRYYRKYPEQYQELHRKLGTDQFIWCCTSAEPNNWIGCEEWELEVPSTKIFKVVNDLLWNVIIGENAYSQELKTHLEYEFIKIAEDSDDFESLAMDKIKELQNPEGGPWKNLFLDDPNDVKATVLLECPISSEWVIRRTQL